MVGPSDTDTERRAASLRLKLGFVLMVAISGGLVARTADASVAQSFAAAAGGLVVGGLLAWWLARSYRQISPGRRR